MDSRRVHDLMRTRFPRFEPVEHEWANMHDGTKPRLEALDALVRRVILAPEVVIEVHRKLGTSLPIGEAAGYIGDHMGEGEIRVADRDFTSFVVIGVNGVATGWSTTDNQAIESGSPAAPAHF